MTPVNQYVLPSLLSEQCFGSACEKTTFRADVKAALTLRTEPDVVVGVL